jgi:2-dehydropantoate 2-reductase
MHFAFVGAGAVGGFYAALLARAGHDVSVVARGAHLEAIRRDGLRIESGAVGSFRSSVNAESDPARVGPADVVVLAVKTYSNPSALPLIVPMVGPDTTVLTVQNGVDSAEEVAAVVGEAQTIAGATYIASGIDAPGIIKHTGDLRRIVLGECTGAPDAVSDRVQRIAAAMALADITVEPVPDSRVPIWKKFIFLAPFAGVTAASRRSIGPVWAEPAGRTTFLGAVAEVEAVARGSGISVAADVTAGVERFAEGLPSGMRSSMLIDLALGKPLELESLPGAVVRRGAAAGVPTPIMETLYAVLKPFEHGG